MLLLEGTSSSCSSSAEFSVTVDCFSVASKQCVSLSRLNGLEVFPCAAVSVYFVLLIV